MLIPTILSPAVDELFEAMVSLEQGWTDAAERSSLRRTTSDVRHHMGMACSCADIGGTCDRYDATSETTRWVVHEAYLSVLALGQLVRRADDEGMAATDALAAAETAIADMLDELDRFVSRADVGMRRVLLDGESVETVVAEMAHAE